MVGRGHLGVMLVAGAVWATCAGGLCIAQTAPAYPAPCSVAPQPAPCGTAPAQGAKPSAADKFPFPGELGGTGGTANSPGLNPAAPAGESASPALPAAPVGEAGPAAKKPSAADFPFPEEDAKPAASGGAGASSSSSSSSSGDDAMTADPDANPDGSPNAAGLKDKGSEGSQALPGRHLLRRVNPIGTKLQNADEREAEDLDIAHFYAQSGDLQGAYLRAQDAVKLAPDDPDAHFALAGIAQKLNKRDEAIAEYTAFLKLDPPDKQAKAARKELARLKP